VRARRDALGSYRPPAVPVRSNRARRRTHRRKSRVLTPTGALAKFAEIVNGHCVPVANLKHQPQAGCAGQDPERRHRSGARPRLRDERCVSFSRRHAIGCLPAHEAPARRGRRAIPWSPESHRGVCATSALRDRGPSRPTRDSAGRPPLPPLVLMTRLGLRPASVMACVPLPACGTQALRKAPNKSVAATGRMAGSLADFVARPRTVRKR
jgi:hypothetical protein